MYMNFVELVGKVFIDVQKTEDAVIFTVSNTEKYSLHHSQDCCESVWLEDVCGDLADLVGKPILSAEESCENNPDASDSGTFSFYSLRTFNGDVTFRFCGESNGYYSETADLYRVN